MKTKLIILDNTLPTIEQGHVPVQIPLFIYGETQYTKNGEQLSYTFLESNADSLISEFNRKGVPVMVDYNHQQLRSKNNGKPAPAAGWINSLIKLEDGLYGIVEWTGAASTAINNKEYRFISPTFFQNEQGQVHSLYNIALTNKPATDNAVDITALEADLNPSIPDITQKGALMKKTLKLLGLEDSADDSQATAAVKALQDDLTAKSNAEKGFIDALKKPLALSDDADLSTVQGVVLGLAAKAATADDATKRITALEDSIENGKRDDLIVTALEDGRLCNAQKEWAGNLTLTALEAFLEKAPKGSTVPTDRIDRGNLSDGDAEQNKTYLKALEDGDVTGAIQNAPILD